MGKGRAPCCDKSKVKRGPWTPAEDFKLVSFIQEHGHPNWRALPSQAGLLRCGKSCRLRWINYLRPDVKRGNFTPKEEETLIKLHQAYGNKWSKIASFLPGRTDNEIKNVWNTHLKKRLGIKSNKRNTSKRTKSKKSPSAFVVESSSLKSSTSLSYNDQVDRDSKATSRSIDNKESPSPSLISCVSNISTNERSHVDLMDTNFDTPLEGLHPDDLGALDELDFWNIVDLDNLCSLQTDSLEGHPFKPLEESNSVGFGYTHYFTSDDMTHNWIRNLEIELGLDDIKK